MESAFQNKMKEFWKSPNSGPFVVVIVVMYRDIDRDLVHFSLILGNLFTGLVRHIIWSENEFKIVKNMSTAGLVMQSLLYPTKSMWKASLIQFALGQDLRWDLKWMILQKEGLVYLYFKSNSFSCSDVFWERDVVSAMLQV